MTEPSSDFSTTELTEIFQRFVRLRPRFKALLPEDLANVKALLAASQARGKDVSLIDRGLLYNIGAVLSHQQEPITMGELSRSLDVPLSTATRIVDWLVKYGYVERLPDPDDRRVVRVALTEAGQGTYRVGNQFIHKRAEKLLSRFTPQEREHLVALMRKLVEALEEEV